MAEPAVLLPDAPLDDRVESRAPQARDGDWPAQGDWAWSDYCRLPDDGRRYEIVRGVLYVSPAPIVLHQFIVSSLLYAFGAHARTHGGVALGAPLDVVLDEVATPVQPDLAFWTRDNLPDLDAARIERVPDLVVEVLSPSTARLDQHVKFSAYEDAGVGEYWIIDPKARMVVVNRLTRGEYFEETQRAISGEIVRSPLVDHFEIAVDDLFPG